MRERERGGKRARRGFMPFLLTAAVWCVPSSHFGAVGFSINYKSKKQKHWKLSPAAAPGHTCPLQ